MEKKTPSNETQTNSLNFLSYENNRLPVFRKMYDLINIIIKIVDKFPKQYKYNIGDRMIKISLDLFKHLFSANRETKNFDEKIKHLTYFLNDYDLLKVLIRISAENKMLSLKDLSKTSVIIENITKQINGWKNKTIKYQITIK